MGKELGVIGTRNGHECDEYADEMSYESRARNRGCWIEEGVVSCYFRSVFDYEEGEL